MWGSGDALVELVSWSAELPLWQRDALRRLVVSGSLTDACLAELLAICGGETGATAAQPCNAAHIRPENASGRTISLRAIRNPIGVNALSAGQQLTFAETGLTVIYGENGAGKSGYARILKNACRAKDGGEVLGDVRAAPAPPVSPQAEIELHVDGNARSVIWQANVACDPDLSLISVFDSAAASMRVDHANEVSYTPLPMRLIVDLANACSTLEARIKAEVVSVAARQPSWVTSPPCANGTRAAAELKALSHTTCVDTLQRKLALTPEDEARREKLAGDLRADPAALVKDLNRRLAGIDRALDLATRAEEAISEGRRDALVVAYEEAKTARTAADAAAGSLFGAAAIPGIGSEAWRRLWEAARRFSETAGYVDRRFPVVDDGSVCVLCVQPLGGGARARLQSFEDFVKADTQAAAARAEAAYAAMVTEWRRLWPEVRALPKIDAFFSADCASPALGADVRGFLRHMRWSLRQFGRTLARETMLPPSPTAALQREREALQAQLTTLQSNEAAVHLAEMRRELQDLDGRAWLASIKEELSVEVTRLAEQYRLRKALETTATRVLTLKSKEISQRLLTNALRDAFAAEVAALEIPNLRVELIDDGAKKGEPQFRLRLVAGAQVALSRVLSEGEFRMVALAAFLAELRVAGDVCGIVFDDPVSSLDNRHRQAVARRLIREAQSRQVVVFTHDLFFLLLLRLAAKDAALHAVHYQHISRSPIGDRKPGIVSANLPVGAQDTKHAIRMMKLRLAKMAGDAASDAASWESHADALCDQLRKVWERALETVIGAVLHRHSPTMHFNRIRELAVLDNEDVEQALDGYGWCSRHMHVEALAGPRSVPTPEDFEIRLGQLLAWSERVEGKQKDAKPRK